MAWRVASQPTAFELDLSDRKQKRIEDPKHLKFIGTLPSAVSGAYGCEACHIRAGNPLYRKKRTGMAQKPDDCWTLPLTTTEHRQQHSENEMAFWRSHGIDPFELAMKLYAVTGDSDQAKSILERSRA